MRGLLALLLLSCSAVDDAGQWVDHTGECAGHPSRWDNACVECHVSWNVPDVEYTCANPRDFTGQCTGAECSEDPITMQCPDGVTVRFLSEGYLQIQKGDCVQTIPLEFDVEVN